MTTPMIRGYGVQQADRFLDVHFPAAVVGKLRAGFSAELQKALAEMDPVAWYPRAIYQELLRAIVSVRNDPEQSRRDLVECGRFTAGEATNTYLRLLMRLLSPPLFVRKVPSFWKRDQTTGEFVIDLVDQANKHIRMRLTGASGYDHIGPAAQGFVDFGMEAIGAKGVSIEQSGWSLSSPSPAEVVYDIRWQ